MAVAILGNELAYAGKRQGRQTELPFGIDTCFLGSVFCYTKAMLKKTFSSYFKHMPAMIYAMAFIFMGATLFFAFLIVGLGNVLTTFNDGVESILHTGGISFRVNIADLRAILGNVNNVEVLKDALNSFVDGLGIENEATKGEMLSLANVAIRSFAVYVIIGLLFVVAGYFLGSYLCGREIKIHNNVKRGILRSIAGWLIETLVFAGLISLATYLLQLWLIILSNQLLIVALVVHYTPN